MDVILMKKKIRIKWKNVIATLIFMIFFSSLIISSINIVKWKLDSKKTDDEIDKIQDLIKISESDDNQNIEIIEQEELSKADPYWDYIKMNLLDVDFSELKGLNSQTKGWLQVNNTNINYPFVQAKDNKYYLNHTFDKSYNSAGWVFLDYRNKLDGTDRNTIIYAHGRLDNTMFGSLRKIFTNGWLNDKSNYVVKLSTERENTLWQVFSVYHISTTSDYIKTEFNGDDDFVEFADMIISRSFYDFNTTVSKNDKFLTLSTCYNDNEKAVLHAKLIKREAR